MKIRDNLFKLIDPISIYSFIKDVVTSLRDKLYLNADEHFSLVLEHLKSAKRNKLTLLDPDETVARVSNVKIRMILTIFAFPFVSISRSDHIWYPLSIA